MRFRSKVALLAGGSLLLLTFLSAWGYSRFFDNRSKDVLRSHLLAEGLAAKKLAEAEVELLTQKLLLLLSEETALRKMPQPSPNRAFLDSDFIEIAVVEEAETGYQPAWAAVRPGYASRWPEKARLELLEGLNFAEVESRYHVVEPVKAPDGQPLFALMIPLAAEEGGETQKIGVGFVTSTTFANVVDPFRRGGKEAALIDESGTALAYTSQQYVGASLASHPVVSQVLKQALNKNRPVSHAGKNLSGQEVLYSFERLGNSNLMVFVAQEPLNFYALISRSSLHVIGYALAVMLILAGGLLWLLKPFENAFNYLQDLAISLAEGIKPQLPENTGAYLEPISQSLQQLQDKGLTAVAAEPSAQTPQVDVEELKNEVRLNAYKEIGSGLSQALKGPVTAILGHAQLARSKARDENLKDHFNEIEKEARKSRDTIENLLKISVDSSPERKPIDAKEALLRATARLRAEFAKSGIQLKSDLQAEGIVLGIPGQLDTIFEELLRNAAQALELAHPKEIEVLSRYEGDAIVFEITDTGSGISASTLDKVFDPFFTTHSAAEKDGLGLTVVKQLLGTMQGQIRISSEEGKFTRVRVELPLVDSVQVGPRLDKSALEPNSNRAAPKNDETPLQKRVRQEAEELLALFDKPEQEEAVFKSTELEQDDFELSELGFVSQPKEPSIEIRKPKVRNPN